MARGRPKKNIESSIEPIKGVYSVTLQSGGLEYKSTGNTVFEALGSLPVNFLQIKGKGNVIVEKGGKKAELLLVMKQVRMLLQNHLRRAGFSKQFEALLNE